VARIHQKAGRENEVEGLLVKMAAAVQQHEHLSVVGGGEPTVFYFYEQYRTDAAFELHRTAPHLAGL
jgi:quinol monooxygenase YgiN